VQTADEHRSILLGAIEITESTLLQSIFGFQHAPFLQKAPELFFEVLHKYPSCLLGLKGGMIYWYYFAAYMP
jgi:hypothetical protein